MKKIKLGEICCTRSGDKGSDTNVGVIFYNSRAFNWAERELTASLVKSFLRALLKEMLLGTLFLIYIHLILFSKTVSAVGVVIL